MLTIKEAFLTENIYYQRAERITVEKLVLHSVGVGQPNAAVFLKNWNKPTYTRACVHAFIDANNGVVYQTMPWDWRAPHAGGSWLNNNAIGVEMCESSYIKYIGQTDRFTINNHAAALAHAKVTYMSAVELFAYLCLRFNLNPLEDIYSHNEAHDDHGLASDHSDPEHYWDQLGTGYTMDGFRKDVANAMNGEVTVTVTEQMKEEEEMYPTLKRGARGKDVMLLQKLLEATGYPCGRAGIDGDFGAGTEAAVEKFQTEYSLTPDKIVGPDTWTALVKAPNAVGEYDALMEKYAALQRDTDELTMDVIKAVEAFNKKKGV